VVSGELVAVVELKTPFAELSDEPVADGNTIIG